MTRDVPFYWACQANLSDTSGLFMSGSQNSNIKLSLVLRPALPCPNAEVGKKYHAVCASKLNFSKIGGDIALRIHGTGKFMVHQ